jgi:hypothetical protein
MALRVQLVNDQIGVLVIDHDDPIDINAIVRSIKRSEENEGIIFEVVLDLEFIKGGRDFIKRCYEEAGGIDAVILINMYDRNPNTRRWELDNTGQINLNKYNLGEDNVEVAIEQTGLERRVLNMMELDVDLETEVSENGSALPPQNVLESLWHSKTILKEFSATASTAIEHQQLEAGTLNFPETGEDIDAGIIWYGQIDFEEFLFDEIDNVYTTPFGFSGYSNTFVDDQLNGVGTDEKYIELLTDGPPSEFDTAPTRNHFLECTEAGVTDVDIQFRMKPRIIATNTGGDVDVNGSGVIGFCEVYSWFEHRSSDNTIKFIEKVGQWTLVSGVGAFETKNYVKDTIDLEVGDKLYWYTTYRVWGEYEAPSPGDGAGQVHHDLYMEIDPTETHITVKSQTTTPETLVSAVMLHEAFERCIQYYTNQVVCFYSDLLGRVDLGYAVDGKFALIVLNNGNWLRGRKIDDALAPIKLITNLKDLIEFVNSIACVGFGFEVIDGVIRFRLEQREFFYNKNSKIASLGKVFNVRKKVDQRKYYNQVEYGYNTKTDVATVNAIDEGNTLRRAIIPIINTKNQLKISTKMITGGYLIEYQRRLHATTEDGKFDDSMFAAVVIRDGMSFKPKKNEGYAEINGIFDPATGYNFDLLPGRIIENWDKFIASGLIRSPRKVVRFSYGTVNYRMTSRKTTETELVREDGDRDLTNVEPIFDPEIYILEDVPMNRDIMKLIRANPYGYLEFEDRFGRIMEGFINDVGVHFDGTKKQANLELLKVHRP